ncbi:P-type DNA transfer protein VirB5 [Duganella sp. FT134W]|uniref:P-type DNA transfer protein VirB5 n=1 Tax=Duganella margarita TaxID=2692170 RepID=A0A7X4H417_9BURK|nr:P-type DNA transfer protein VirB5 [Duganella margarita]MYM73952.1 P-type DNA transfer protein VirB5 [Duganella margarita]
MKLRPLIIASIILFAHGAAHAQMAVIDSAGLGQAIKQVQAWEKQYKQMIEQQNQLKQQLTAATGSRGLGGLASNPLLQATVPSELPEIYQALQSQGWSGLSVMAQAIRLQGKLYNCENRSGDALITCQRLLNNGAQQQALLQQALALTTARSTQIQALQQHINATSDPKSIAELQARLQVETTQVGNDANRLALMRGLAEAADRSAEQAVREKVLHSLTLKTNGSENFHFVPMK